MARFLFATDVHGNDRAYDKLLELAAVERAEAIVLGGDLFPLCEPLPFSQLDWARDFFAPWLQRAREVAPVFAILGNDDAGCLADEFSRWNDAGLLRAIHQRRVDFLHGLRIFGYTCVPVTPFRLKDWDRFDRGREPMPPVTAPVRLTRRGMELIGDLREALGARPSIEDDLRTLPRDGWDRTVVVTHSPPFDTHLDRLYDGSPIGSRAIRAFIEEVQPALTLHGHIHESPRMSGRIDDRIGRTPGFNPGDSARTLRALVLEGDGREWTGRLVP